MTEDISVALATYNGGRYLRDQLDSLLRQTHQPDEIVVCDDNSSDGTVEILESYADEYPGLFEVHTFETNAGPFSNFERAFERCSGDFIAICDQDDVWEETKIATQHEYLSESESVVCYHDSAICDEELHQDGSTLWGRHEVNPGGFDDRIDLLLRQIKSNFVQGASIVFDARLLETVKPMPDIVPYDQWLTFVGQAIAPPAVVERPLIKWRRHDNTDTGTPGENPAVDSFHQKISTLYDMFRLPLDERRNETNYWIERSEEFARRFCEIDKAVFTVDPLPLGRALYERLLFFENRYRVHDTSEMWLNRLSAEGANQLLRPSSVDPQKSRLVDSLYCLFVRPVLGNRLELNT